MTAATSAAQGHRSRVLPCLLRLSFGGECETMPRRPWCLTLLSLLLLPAAAEAQAELPAAEQYHVRLEYLWWSPALSGELQKGFSEREGTLLNAQADLGIERQGANLLQGTLRLGKGWKLRGSWTPLDYRGDVVADSAFVYGTTVVAPGQRVVTSLSGNYSTAALEWDPLERSRGFLGVLLGVKYFDVDTTLVAVADDVTISRVAETDRLPIPVFGLAGRVYVTERISLEGELSGLPAGERGHLFELLLAGRGHLSDRIAGTLGWRKLALEGRDGRDYLKIGLSRWTFGVEISL